MFENVRKEIARLADELPKGYGTFDANGRPVIQSKLDGLAWFGWAQTLLQSRGHDAEKAALRAELARSEGIDNSGGLLYEFIAALDSVSEAPRVKRRTPRPARHSRVKK